MMLLCVLCFADELLFYKVDDTNDVISDTCDVLSCTGSAIASGNADFENRVSGTDVTNGKDVAISIDSGCTHIVTEDLSTVTGSTDNESINSAWVENLQVTIGHLVHSLSY